MKVTDGHQSNREHHGGKSRAFSSYPCVVHKKQRVMGDGEGPETPNLSFTPYFQAHKSSFSSHARG